MQHETESFGCGSYGNEDQQRTVVLDVNFELVGAFGCGLRFGLCSSRRQMQPRRTLHPQSTHATHQLLALSRCRTQSIMCARRFVESHVPIRSKLHDHRWDSVLCLDHYTAMVRCPGRQLFGPILYAHRGESFELPEKTPRFSR